jgi:hypothetical protein
MAGFEVILYGRFWVIAEAHPEGMNNTCPAKRDRYCNASRSSTKHTARAHLSKLVPERSPCWGWQSGEHGWTSDNSR